MNGLSEDLRNGHFAAITAIVLVAAMLTVSPAAATDLEAILFPLVVNDVPRGEVPIVLRDGDVLMRSADLEAASLTGAMWERLRIVSQLAGTFDTIGGSPVVSLRSLAPLIEYTVDEANLTLTLRVNPALFEQTAVQLQTRRPEALEYVADKSAFFNYGVTTASGFDDPTAFGELGVNARGKLILTTFNHDQTNGLVRGITSLTADDRRSLRRYTFGDATFVTGPLGGGGLVGGVAVAKNFNIDPYFLRFPSYRFAGTALTPSQVDVYVNGILVAQQNVPPGPFELRDIPLTGGAGNTQIVIRDALGNERIQDSPFYYSTTVLAPGLNEYTYALGFLRESFSSSSFDYGDPIFAAGHRRGMTDSLTLGGRLEAGRSLLSAGPNLSMQTRFGDTDVSLAGSHADGHNGSAAAFAHRYQTRTYSLGLITRLMSREYANTSLPFDVDRPLADLSAFASFLFRRTSVGVLLSHTDNRDTDDLSRGALQGSYLINRFLSLFVSAGVLETAGEREPEYAAGLSIYLGGNTSAGIGFTQRQGQTRASVDVQKSVPAGTGFGYRVQLEDSDLGRHGNGSVQYQNRYGRYAVAFNSGDSPGFAVAGGAVYQGGKLLLTRPVQDSFALVRVPGVEGVRVYSNNLVVGRTDADGNLLVPDLLSYYGNRLRIEDKDIPLDYEVGAVERSIAPPYRGGALVQFSVRRIQSVTGSVAIHTTAGEVTPAFGQFTLTRDGVEVVSPLGNGAEFYLENIASGTYTARIEYTGGSCVFTITIPVTTEPFVRLGKVVCAGQEAPKP